MTATTKTFPPLLAINEQHHHAQLRPIHARASCACLYCYVYHSQGAVFFPTEHCVCTSLLTLRFVCSPDRPFCGGTDNPQSPVTSDTMFIARAVSIGNCFIASSALAFQVCVLYPWHKQLDEDFEALKKEHLQVLDAIKGRPEAAIAEKPSVRQMITSLGGWKL